MTLIIAPVLSFSAELKTIEPFWRLSPSPPTKDVHVLALDSNDVLYAGVWGDGIYKTSDKGKNWLKVSSGLENTNVTCIEITAGGKMYAGTFGGGVFFSNNGGINWTAVNGGGLTNLYVKAIGIYGKNKLIAGTMGSGVFKTTDNGQSWTQINEKLFNYDINAIVIAKDTSFVIGTNGGGVYRSMNRGDYWIPTGSGLKSLVITDMVKNKDGDIFATTLGGGVHVSLQNGSGWQVYFNRDNMPAEGSCIAMLTSDEPIVGTYGRGVVRLDVLYAGVPGQSPWRNTERTYFGVNDIVVDSKGDVYSAQPFNGIMLSEDGGYTYKDTIVGFDIPFQGRNIEPLLAYGKNNLLVTSVNGGIYRSTDKGNSWNEEAADGITVHCYYRDNAGKLYAATADGAYISDDEGASWTKLNWSNEIYSIAANNKGQIFIGDSAIRKSTDGGNTWTEKGYNADVFKMEFIELGPNGNIYCNMSRGQSDPPGSVGLFSSTDDGETWNLLVNDQDYMIMNLYFRNGKMYAASGQGLIISSNGGTSWVTRDFGFPTNLVGNLGFTNSGSILAQDIIKNWFMRSRDDGITWDTLNFGKAESAIGAIQVSEDGDIYITTSNIYRAIEDEDLQSPSLSYPINDEGGQALNPLLKWGKVSNTDLYEVQISKGAEFDEIAESAVTGDTKWNIVVPLEFGTKYHWRVRSKRNSSVSNWSQTGTFYTAIAAPELVFPDYNSFKNDTNITFRWEKVEEAANYQFQLANDQAFKDIIKDIDEIDTTFTEVKNLKTDSIYYWRVRSKSFLSNSNWTQVWPFATKMSSPMLVSPKDSAELYETKVTLIWDTVPKATQYNVRIARDFEFTDIIYDGPAQSDTSFMTDILEIGKTYYWQIKALNELNESYPSEIRMFRVKMEGISLIKPANNAINVEVPVEFAWDAPLVAEGYYFQLARDEQFTDLVDVDSTLTDTFKIEDNLSYGNYYWRVKFKYGELFSDWSAVWTFTSSPGVVELLAPDNDALNTDTTVQLTWDAPKSAESFHLQVSAADDFQNPIVDREGLTDKLFDLEGLDYFTKYFWRLRFKIGDNYSNWSEVRSFTTKLMAPSLIYPEYDAKDVETNPDISWSEINGAAKYHLQLSKDIGFGSLIIDNPEITTTLEPVEGLDTMTTFFWRVRALNGSSASDWTEVWKFTTNEKSTGVRDVMINSLDMAVYPAPFKDMLNIDFSLDYSMAVKIIAMDESGRTIEVITNKLFGRGRQKLSWKPTGIAAGTYYLYFTIDGMSFVKKAVYLK